MFYYRYYSESNPKQIAKSVVFVMNTLSATKVIDYILWARGHCSILDLFTYGSLSLGANLVYIWEPTLRFHTAPSYESLGPTVDGPSYKQQQPMGNVWSMSPIFTLPHVQSQHLWILLAKTFLACIILWRNEWVIGNVPSIVREG